METAQAVTYILIINVASITVEGSSSKMKATNYQFMVAIGRALKY